MRMRRIFLFRLLLALLSLPLPLALGAQVQRTTLFGIGGASVLDTYLTPFSYSGPSGSVSLTTERPAHWGGGHVSTMGHFSLRGAYTESPVSGAHIWDGELNLAGGWHRNWHLCDGRLRLAAGGLMECFTGGSYGAVGGNNPGQARLGADVAASGIAAYRFSVKASPWEAALRVDIPLLGLQFAQQYGESYYELFHLGHTDRNLRLTAPWNAPSLRLQATLSLPVRHSRLTFGYGAEVRQSALNGLRQHGWYNQFLIGFSRTISLLR